MKVVGVTMRTSLVTPGNNGCNSIESSWIEFLRTCGFITMLLPNDTEAAAWLLRRVCPSAILLTGGGDPECITGVRTERDKVEYEVIQWGSEARIPVIGVCRGMEVLLSLEGASWQEVPGHVGTVHTTHGLIQRTVNSFHKYVTRGPVGPYKILATDQNGGIECVADEKRSRFGMMWHPERNVPFQKEDRVLFQSWLNNNLSRYL